MKRTEMVKPSQTIQLSSYLSNQIKLVHSPILAGFDIQISIKKWTEFCKSNRFEQNQTHFIEVHELLYYYS